MALTMDDRDPAVRYTGGNWGKGGASEEYLQTTTWADVVGATAWVTFTGKIPGRCPYVLPSDSRAQGEGLRFMVPLERMVV